MTAMRPPADPSGEVGREAAEWLLAMNEHTVSLQDRARFEAWLAADPEHARVYRAQKRAWAIIAGMPHLLEEGGETARALASPASASAAAVPRAAPPTWDSKAGSRKRRPWRLAAAACLLVAAVGTWPLWGPLLPFGTQVYETGIAQVRDVTLEDGSLVTLGAASRIAVDFDGDARRVELARGEAFFEVTRDTARPFLVTADGTRVRVVGTKFDVRRGVDGVRVSVLEGRVEVSRAGSASASAARDGAGVPVGSARASVRTDAPASTSPVGKQVLTAGEAMTADRDGALAKADSVNLPDVGAWRSGRLVYVDARLRDIVADINRYHAGSVEIADPALGQLQLTTTFRVDQIDGVLSVLTRALPVQAVDADAGRIVLTARR